MQESPSLVGKGSGPKMRLHGRGASLGNSLSSGSGDTMKQYQKYQPQRDLSALSPGMEVITWGQDSSIGTVWQVTKVGDNTFQAVSTWIISPNQQTKKKTKANKATFRSGSSWKAVFDSLKKYREVHSGEDIDPDTFK